GEPERKRRSLVRGPLLAEQLVADLRPVPVRHDDARLLEERRELGQRAAKVRELLGRRAALLLAHERVTAQRENGCHATGVGVSTRPCSASASASVGSPISSSR